MMKFFSLFLFFLQFYLYIEIFAIDYEKDFIKIKWGNLSFIEGGCFRNEKTESYIRLYRIKLKRLKKDQIVSTKFLIFLLV